MHPHNTYQLSFLAEILTIDQKIHRFTSKINTFVHLGHTYKPGLSFGSINRAPLTTNQTSASIDLLLCDRSELNFIDAEIHIFSIWESGPETKVDNIFSGFALSTKLNGESVRLLVAPISLKLMNRIGSFYSPVCRAQLGDNRCKKDLRSIGVITTVSNVFESRLIEVLHVSESKNFFQGGHILFQEGPNSGQICRIYENYDRNIRLHTAPKHKVSPSDRITIFPGCKKTLEDCVEKFNNAINFRGEPFIHQQK